MTSDFRRRCESALTHPATLGALAVLLVNDLVLKALWPHPWTTGKLSDLAWIVFAPPLLAYLLSFAKCGNVRRQQVAFGIAYVGLPLLYAAFNTFAPLHDLIMQGFSLVTGGLGGSPLDPWDSAVIPLALAVALWVWRRGPVAPGGLRSRLRMIAASLAAMATVAYSECGYEGPDQGITVVGTSPEGVAGGIYWDYLPFESHDGGLSWTTRTSPRKSGDQQNYSLGGESVDTLRGTYRIEEADILLQTPDGEPRVVYSAAHLRESANRWYQGIENRRFEYGGEISSGPTSLTFDSHSGNVIAAMGTQGVIVGKPDGTWTAVGVGTYIPTNFSFFGKAKALFSEVDFWGTVLLLPLSLIATFFAVLPLFCPPRGVDPGFFSMLFIVTGVVIALFVSFRLLIWVGSVDETENLVAFGGVDIRALFLSVVSIFAALIAIGATPEVHPGPGWRVATVSFLGMVAFITLSLLPWLLFGWNFGVSAFLAILLCVATTSALTRFAIQKHRLAMLERPGNQPPQS